MKENFSDNYVIGFGGEYYTLWEKCHNSDGEVEHLIYVKNISKERSVAEKLFPGVEINETLHGYKYEVREVDPIYKMPNVFKFGRYKGEPIYTEGMEISKVYADYVANMNGWFLTDEDQISAAKVLNESGFYKAEVIKNSDGHVSHISIMSVEEYEEMVENKVKRDNLIDSGSFIIILNRNLSDEGEYFDNDLSIELDFKDFALYSYQGYYYGLPSKNGKGKRVKGKTIKITDFEVVVRENDFAKILVKDWDFVK